ncbi:MAG: formate/nitrite transporter family protein, partial [Cloacibacillus evryensis]
WIAFGALDMSGKYIACMVPISAFVAMGFEHCVANMYFISLGLLLKGDPAVMARCALPAERLLNLTQSGFWRNLIPVTLGNMIGAAVLVGVLYYIVFRKELTAG